MKKAIIGGILILMAIFVSYLQNKKDDEYFIKHIYDNKNKMVYAIKKNSTESFLVKIDENGKTERLINFSIEGKNNTNNFINNITIDDKQNLYFTLLNRADESVLSETIYSINSNGNNEKMLYKISSNAKDQLWPDSVKDIKIMNNKLYLLRFINENYEIIKMDLNGANSEKIKDKVEGNLGVFEAKFINDTGFVYSIKDGSIYYNSIETGSKLLSENIERNLLPTNFSFVDNELYFVDSFDMSFRKMKLGNSKETVLFRKGQNMDDESEMNFEFLKDIKVIDKDSLSAIGNYRDQTVLYIKKGNTANIIDTFKESMVKVILSYALNIFLAIVVFIIGILLADLHQKFLNGKMPIIVKIMCIMIPCAIVFVIANYFVSKYLLNNTIRNEINSKIYSISSIISREINVDELEKLKIPKEYGKETYNNFFNLTTDSKRFDSRKEDKYNIKIGNINDYTATYCDILFIDKSNEVRFGLSSDEFPCMYPKRYSSIDNKSIKFAQMAKTEDQIIMEEYSDKVGSWKCIWRPLRNKDKEVVAIIEVGIDLNKYERYKGTYYSNLLKSNLLIIFLTMIAFSIILFYILKPMSILRNKVNLIASGNWNERIEIKSKDEIGDFAKVINAMAINIREAIEKMTQLSESYYRFVPENFIKKLGKKGVLDVNLGDQVKSVGCVLVLKIRNFYTETDKMDNEEIVNYLNEVLKVASPIISEYGGIVEGYQDNGMMAFYDNTKRAVNASLRIKQKIALLNDRRKVRNENIIHVDISINKGPVVLAIVGEEKRLGDKFISQVINDANNLNSIGVKLSSSLIVSKNVFEDILKQELNSRYLGEVKSNDKLIEVYDIFDGDDKYTRDLKKKSKNSFEAGINLYRNGHFFEARQKFIEVVKINPNDKCAQVYLFLADKYMSKNMIDDFDKTIDIRSAGRLIRA